MKKVYFKTFGCRTNQFDTQVMIANLGEFSVTEDDNLADAVVINSCTVTNGADSGVRAYINALSKRNPKAKVLLTGCGAYSKGEELFAGGKVHSVFGHSEKKEITTFLSSDERLVKMGSLDFIDETIVSEFVGKTRAFIKIQEGCDFACSYCIIPSVRGGARSHDERQILEQIEILASNGFGEFILTGTNVGSYGKEKGTSLAALLEKIALIRGVRRVRIGSLEPIQIDEKFKELLCEPWMARHLHIAIQHGHDEMLEKMNRRNRVASDYALFEELASKGYALGTDFIVGFPGETSRIWEETMGHMRRMPLTHIHAFTYSKRDGTPAAMMKEIVSGDVAKQRHHELTSLIDEKNYAFRLTHASTPLDVLVENEKEGLFMGYDQFYNAIKIQSDQELAHSWVSVTHVNVKQDTNKGSV